MVGLVARIVGGSDATGHVMGLKLHVDKPKPDAAIYSLAYSKFKTLQDMGGDNMRVPGTRPMLEE